jgi:hypothetical protein
MSPRKDTQKSAERTAAIDKQSKDSPTRNEPR